jgi:hypothetical protein
MDKPVGGTAEACIREDGFAPFYGFPARQIASDRKGTEAEPLQR